MNQAVAQEPIADICLLLEGTWPYVRGGVSSWIHQLILGQPDVTFSVMFIGGQREAYGKRQYLVPANVVHIEEVFLDEAWQAHGPRTPPAKDASQAELGALYRFFHHPDQPDVPQGEAVLEALTQARLSLDDVLYSRASWDVLSAGYQQHCSDPSFIDYFWTLRTMQSPLLMLAELSRRVPRARALHAVSTGYAGLLGCLLKQRWGCTFILSEHGIYTKERKIDLSQASWIVENTEDLRGGLASDAGYVRSLWIRFFERIGLLVYNCADPVIALYEGNRQRQIKDGASPDRTRVIPNGIELQQWASALASRAPGIAPVIGLVGRVVPIKDVKTFIRAMRSVVSAMPEAQAWIVGPEEENPDYASECHGLVTSMGLEAHVHFLGFQRIQEILPQLGLMVLTSISEAQPLVILEAWAAGTPVVTSDVGSCRELIEGCSGEDRELGLAGEVVAIADPQATARAILDLLHHPQRWESAQASGLARVNRYYSEALMLERYRELYRAAVENN